MKNESPPPHEKGKEDGEKLKEGKSEPVDQ